MSVFEVQTSNLKEEQKHFKPFLDNSGPLPTRNLYCLHAKTVFLEIHSTQINKLVVNH